MLELILASGNPHKAEEFAELFQGKIQVAPAPAALEPEESGESYLENALIKARSYYDAFKRPALADDSGLSVDALPELLGVRSARFCPDKPSYADKCRELLRLLDEGQLERAAHFTCVLCFYLSPDEIYFFEGRVHGQIGRVLKGEHGFGYDPIFVPTRNEEDGKSLAELPEWKNQNSHRAKAVREALQFFQKSGMT